MFWMRDDSIHKTKQYLISVGEYSLVYLCRQDINIRIYQCIWRKTRTKSEPVWKLDFEAASITLQTIKSYFNFETLVNFISSFPEPSRDSQFYILFLFLL